MSKFEVEIECLLADLEMQVRDERDRIQKAMDDQAVDPEMYSDPDEYLEGAIRGLDWVMVNIQKRIVELK